MCMARVNVYLPDDLAEEVKAAGLNVSALAQESLRSELRRRAITAWLADLDGLHRRYPTVDVTDDDLARALDEAKDEFGRWPRE